MFLSWLSGHPHLPFFPPSDGFRSSISRLPMPSRALNLTLALHSHFANTSLHRQVGHRVPDSNPSSVTSQPCHLSALWPFKLLTYPRCFSVELTELLWGLSELVAVKLLKHCLAHSKCGAIAGYCTVTAAVCPTPTPTSLFFLAR